MIMNKRYSQKFIDMGNYSTFFETIKYQNKKWLKHQYIDLIKSTRQIGNECNVTHKTILEWLKRFGIPRRKVGFKQPIRYSANQVFSNSFREQLRLDLKKL